MAIAPGRIAVATVSRELKAHVGSIDFFEMQQKMM